jgi:hypothetical protein
MDQPVYPIIPDYEGFKDMIERVPEEHGVAKGIRKFSIEQVDEIKDKLCNEYGDCEKHLVSSKEAQHLLFVVKNVEISISATMVYFRYKSPISDTHYNNVKE